MINILLVDNSVIARSGVKRIIEEKNPLLRVIGEASGGIEALRMIRKGDYNLMILDYKMDDLNGLEVLQLLRLRGYEIPVLILTVMPKEQLAMQAIRAGAQGYLNKDAPIPELMKAIDVVIKGGQYLGKAFMGNIPEESEDLPHNALSKREFEVLCMIGEGKKQREISEALGVGIKTVGTYRSRILQKLRLSKTAELIQYVVQHLKR